MNKELDPEVVYSLYDEYSVTCVATKLAWCSLCMRCSRGGYSGSIFGGVKDWG